MVSLGLTYVFSLKAMAAAPARNAHVVRQKYGMSGKRAPATIRVNLVHSKKPRDAQLYVWDRGGNYQDPPGPPHSCMESDRKTGVSTRTMYM